MISHLKFYYIQTYPPNKYLKSNYYSCWKIRIQSPLTNQYFTYNIPQSRKPVILTTLRTRPLIYFPPTIIH